MQTKLIVFAIIAWTQANLELDNNTNALFQAVQYPVISKLDLMSAATGKANQELYMLALEYHHFASIYAGTKNKLRKDAVSWILRAELQEPLRSVNHLTVLVKVWSSSSAQVATGTACVRLLSK